MAQDGEANDGQGAAILASLRETVNAWSDLPHRRRYTSVEWQALPPADQKAYWDLAAESQDRVPVDAFRKVRALGQLRYGPAVPTLIELWERCPNLALMGDAGRALWAIGTPEARAALRAAIDEYGWEPTDLAVRTLLTDEGDPWENLGWLFTGDRLGTAAGLGAAALALEFSSSQYRQWPDLVSTDRRWLGLCVSLHDHPVLAPAARLALRNADPAVTGPVLDAAAAARAERARRAPALIAGSLAGRYQRGDHRAVWRELSAVVPLNDDWRAEAHRVAFATMERVRENASRLVTALIARGWPITIDEALPGPEPGIGQYLERLEHILGTPVPPALAAFWQVVGMVTLVPAHSPLPAGLPASLRAMDPLELGTPVAVGIANREEDLDIYTELEDEQAGAHPEATLLHLTISRSRELKVTRGGTYYGIQLPYDGADPPVDDGQGLSLTDYLRKAFAGKGFLAAPTSDARDGEAAEAAQWLAGVHANQLDF
jgi:hypothetical protein